MSARSGSVWAAAALAGALALYGWAQPQASAATAPQAGPPPLATITGASVALSGGAAELDALGRLRVPDGATIDLAGASARLDLLRGGAITLCGPARVSVATGGGDAFLVSLDRGALYLRYASPVADTLLTPDYRITTVVPPDQLATVSASVALRPNGVLCLLNRGSALSVERLWDGDQQYVINGQGLQLHPEGASEVVTSCPCTAAAPPPVPPVPDSSSGAAGALFPQQPALTVSAAGAAAGSAPPAATPPGAAPAHHNFVMRFLRWFVGKG